MTQALPCYISEKRLVTLHSRKRCILRLIDQGLFKGT